MRTYLCVHVSNVLNGGITGYMPGARGKDVLGHGEEVRRGDRTSSTALCPTATCMQGRRACKTCWSEAYACFNHVAIRVGKRGRGMFGVKRMSSVPCRRPATS